MARILVGLLRSTRSLAGTVVFIFLLAMLAWPQQAVAALRPFAPAFQLASGGKATTFAAVADLNGDGCLDIVAVNYTSNDMSVFLGDGKGGFSVATLFPVGLGPKAIALRDVTGDGALDAVVPLEGSSAVAVVPGDGHGGFGSAVLYPVGTGPKQLVVVDINHDGLPDIVTANEAPNSLSVLLGQLGGGFFRMPDVPNATRPRWPAVGDFNEDGNPDIAVASESSSGVVEVFLGDGLGAFPTRILLHGGVTPKAAAVADFNGDGHPDIAFSDESLNDVRLWLGAGAGSFTAGADVPVGAMPKSILTTDIDGDGHLDVFTANYTSDSVSVLLGDGAVTLATGSGPKSVAAGDFNGDGVADIVTADNDGSTISVILSNLSDITGLTVSPSSFYGGPGATGRTTIDYAIAQSAQVAVLVRDAAGRNVRTLQPATSQAPGAYSLTWDGTGDGGATLADGVYSVVVDAASSSGLAELTSGVKLTFTPVASEATLGLDAQGNYVLHTVIEKWSETLGGQGPGDYYFDGQVQPWELTARSGASVTLYVGTNTTNPQGTTAGGSASAATDSLGVADLPFPTGLTWRDAKGGTPIALYYSVQVTYQGSSRWYPATGRYPLASPTAGDGHIKFAFVADIQTPSSDVSTPDLHPGSLDAALGAFAPYGAIPRLSRSNGWAAVLAGLRRQQGLNLLLGGGDEIAVGGDSSAPDDGATQLRTLFDNRQSFSPPGEWSLGSLGATVPIALAPGNHEGIDSAPMQARWLRWVHTPNNLPYYTIDDGDVHFVVLDNYSASADPATNYAGWIGLQRRQLGGSRTVTVNGVAHTFTNSAQADWLIGALTTAKPWTVVVMHFPMFDSAGGPYSQANQTGKLFSTNMYYYGERDRLLRLFAADGVDLVLQGHLHYYRRHLEKVHNASRTVTSAQTYVTDGLAGGPPDEQWKDTRDPAVPYLDWVDLNHNGVRDPGEPRATSANAHWDAAHFGKMNSLKTASGYFGTPDAFHATGQEYDKGLSFSYAVFQTGTDGKGQPKLTMTVERISWDGVTHAWGPWTVYESVRVPQLRGSFFANRLAP